MIDIEKSLEQSMLFTSYKIEVFFKLYSLLNFDSNIDFNNTFFVEKQLQEIHQEKLNTINGILCFFTKNEEEEIIDVLLWNKDQNNYFFCYVYGDYDSKNTNEEKKDFVDSSVKNLFQLNQTIVKLNGIKLFS